MDDYSKMSSVNLFSDNMKKTQKKHKKPKGAKSVPRKTMSVIERDLKSEYQKYVNAINRRKVCKKKTFRQFVDDKIGKKHKRKTKKVKVEPEEPMPSADTTVESSSSVETEPSAAAEEPVSPEPSSTAAEEPVSPESSSVAEEPASSATEEPASTSTTEETKPEPESKGIFDTIKSALTPSEEPKKTGGRRKKNKRKSGSRRR